MTVRAASQNEKAGTKGLYADKAMLFKGVVQF
jgi:hypothetical protein